MLRTHDKHYIDGTWSPSTGNGSFDVVNASTEAVMGRVPAGSADDAARAVQAAARAFDDWRDRSMEERARLLERVCDLLAAQEQQLSETIAAEVGMPLKLSTTVQIAMPLMAARAACDLARTLKLEEEIGNSLVVHEPVGVVACITPWNYPLNQVLAKVVPALLVGCTVTLKPSEVAPLSAFMVADAMHEAGIPRGVFNLVSGDGPTVGEALVAHPLVDMVSFTGSTRAGKRVAELAAQGVKRVALELGGKSANVILDDADLEAAVKAGVNNCFLNSGQTCSALTRMLVPRTKLKDAEQLAKSFAEKMTLGDALTNAGRLGPLASAAQRDRVRRYIKQGVEEGATLITGGAEPPDGLTRGYFVKPTVFSNVTRSMTIAREEIFGPVLCMMPYDDEAEAIDIANDTPYGLSGAVWSSNAERAHRVAKKLRTGQVAINGGSFNPQAPFGGFKQSGIGREGGKHGLLEFLETKSLQRS